MNIYFGHVDTLKVADSDRPVFVIDGLASKSGSEVFERVNQWLTGDIELQLVYGQDVPNRDGIYICTDVHGNVRYGQVMATAANCFRFQEHYANGGYTAWYDKQSAKGECLHETDLDMSELSNWMLLLPLVSGNACDVTKYPQEYTADKTPTPCSITPRPHDNRNTQQLNAAENAKVEDAEQAVAEAHYKFYRWTSNLRGDSLMDFVIDVFDFIGSRKDLPQDASELDDVSFTVWKAYAIHLNAKYPEHALLTDSEVRKARNIFVLARSCYFTLFGIKPRKLAYFDSELEKIRNGKTR